MTRLSDIVLIEHRNVRSVNVERELESASPLDGFIVTEQVLDGVRRLLAALQPAPIGRAWSITGPYGAGKSSFAHFLCALLAGETEPAFRRAHRLLAAADAPLAKSIKEARCTLGVMERGFIRAAATAEREPVSSTVARALLRGAEGYWGGRRGRRPNVLHELHSATSGVQRGEYPDPRFVLDALEQLMSVAPVIVAVDELGKALEFAADRSRESDLYLLQQLAERFSSDEEINGCMLALQHLAFEEYATGLSAARRREWRKIQGRFEDVAFAGGAGHSARLIGASLRLQGPPSGVEPAMKRAAAEFVATAPDVKEVLGALGPQPAGYPLHPTTVPILAELAGRFGQHERSLMAFLTSEAPDALPALLRSTVVAEPPPFVRLPEIYDYFVGAAASMAIMGEDAARLREIRGRVAEATGLSDLEARCAKTIGVLNLAGRGGVRASSELVVQAIAGPDAGQPEEAAISSALDGLVARGLVTFRDFAGEYRVWQGSDFDVAGAIAQSRQQLAQEAVISGPPISHIAVAYPARPLVARRHSQHVDVLRYFEARYVSELPAEPPTCERPDADGLLLYLLATEIPEKGGPSTTADGRPLVMIASRFVSDITEASLDAAATRAVLEASKNLDGDVAARREIRHRAAFAQAALSERVEAAFDPARNGVTCVANGKPVQIYRQRDFSELLSALCDETYHLSPVIRNEMLNRRELTSQGAKTRRELVDRMFTSAAESKLGIDGYGPVRSMYESVLAGTGIHRKRADRLALGAPDSSTGTATAWEAINQFLDEAIDHPVGLDKLYAFLMAPPYGMKEGPIPLLLAAVLIHRSDDVFVFEEGSFLPRLGSEHFERLVKTPGRFAVKRAAMFGVRAGVFRELQQLLVAGSASLPADVRNATTIGVVRPLILLLQALPEFTRTTGRVSPEAQRVREALATTREPDELLFSALPRACGFSGFEATDADDAVESSYISVLKASLDELMTAYDKLLEDLGDTLRMAFDTRGPRHALREELRTRARHLVEHVIDRRLRSFLLVAANEDFDDREWLEALATVLAQKPPGSWSDSDIAIFESVTLELARSFRRVELLHLQTSSAAADGYIGRRITITQPDGTEASQLVWLEEPRSRALDGILDRALAAAARLAGSQGPQRLLALLAERVLTDGASTTQGAMPDKEQPRAEAAS